MNSLTNKEYCNIDTRSKVCLDSDLLNQTEQNQIAGNLVKKWQNYVILREITKVKLRNFNGL